MIEQKNELKKVYWNGAYYNALSKDVEVLKQQAPHLYAKLFPRAEYKARDEKIQVYQIYYDTHSFENLDAGFIPYQTTSPPHNFENDVILDIWRKRDWVNAKYIGVLSWRFYEKTLLSSKDIKYKGKVITFDCVGYDVFDHPFSRKCFDSVNEMVQMADKAKLFPFKLDRYKVKKNVWCNYWIATPKIFDDYCTNYLSKAIEFFKGTDLYDRTEKHRDKQYLSMTFFLEGLFSVYLTEKNL